jgi:ADP-ribose pyrophosphatase
VGIETTTSQEYVYFGRILNLRVDTVRLDSGMPARREIVEHRDAVVIVAQDSAPLDGKGNVLLVRQFRKPTEQELYELPAGVMDEGESPEEAARRELSEETGLTADSLAHLCSFYSAPGFTTEYMHLYAAGKLRPLASPPDEDEDIETLWLPLADALQMIDTGEIRDAKTIIGLLMVSRNQTCQVSKA